MTADNASLRGKRDYATLAILLGCGLRRAELTALRVEDIQQREEHWVIADLVGKGGHIRTIPVPDWVKAGIDAWTVAAGVTTGALLRSINKAGRVWGTGFSPKVIWGVVKQKAKACEIPALAPHDLRRTCARLCHQAGGELEQIQFLLGHVSVQTTERYLGCKQRFRNAVSGLEYTLINSGLSCSGAGSDGAGCPTQVEVGAKGEDHLSAVELGLETYPFRGRWKAKAERFSKNHRIRHDFVTRGPYDLQNQRLRFEITLGKTAEGISRLRRIFRLLLRRGGCSGYALL